jgi:Excalibur calcium-binding domain
LIKRAAEENAKVVPHERRTLEGPNAEVDLARLQRRFRSVSRRHERVMALRRFSRAARWWVPIAAAIAILCWSLMDYTQWPLVAIVKHIAAFPHCQVAGAVGLAPAGKGQPGYWRHHDGDGDGIACEPFE